VLNIWSTLSPYFTAKFRNEDPTLLLIYTLYAYPIAIGSMTVSMQLGALLFGKIDMRLQLFIGTVIYCSALFLSQFMETYTSFLFVFAVMGGFGFGIIFFLPIGCVWSYFPLHKPYVAGAVLSWCALSSCYYYYMTPETAQLGLNKLEDAINTQPRQWVVTDWPDISQMEIFCND
jgi:MFS family permease